MEGTNQKDRITRRSMFHAGSAALAGVSALAVANAQDIRRKVERSSDHHLPNETDPGPKNARLEAENPSSVWSPETDHGTVHPYKYSFGLARKRITDGDGRGR
jgi:oxalate decarboxylase